MYILTIDPGKTTGWTLYDTDYAFRPEFGQDEFMAFQVRMWNWARNNHDSGRQCHIVCEDFIITTNTGKKTRGETTWSLETKGCARLACEMFGHDFFTYSPVQAKSFGQDALLKQIGWWEKGADHAQDAGRHLILHIAEKFPDLFAQLVST